MALLISTFNINLGDNCIQNFYLGRYIVGYTVGNLVLQRCAKEKNQKNPNIFPTEYPTICLHN